MNFLATAQSWANFYLLTGEAAATLTGLMFVAVTFGASLAGEDLTTARAFVDPILTHFVQVLLVSCLFIVPSLTPAILGIGLVGMAAFRSARLASIFGRLRAVHRKNGDMEVSDWIINIAIPGAAYLGLFAVGTGFILEMPIAFNGLAIDVGLMLVLGIFGAWELLLWMATRVRSKSGP
ncbi:MAG: hypothetical protein JST54_27695 [Deltaproteobacteria bacterium]|nr:hypothetical protein [Deltaproteobacteria bacterium]